jgi:uncharacterized heparinase superfamily protein
VLLQPRGAKAGAGWWLRNDAADVSLEPAVRLLDGRPYPATQIVLKAPLGAQGNARIRWKLSPADKAAPLDPAEKTSRARRPAPKPEPKTP